MKPPRYVIGMEGALVACREEPEARRRYPGEDHKPTWFWREYNRLGFHAERGAIREWFEHFINVHPGRTRRKIYARTIPAELVPEVAALEARIEEAKEALSALYAEQQALLLVAATRGGKVKVPK